MKNIYSALSVALYIVNYSNDKNYLISNLKLQKLLYLVQAFFLISKKDGGPFFNDVIEAWAFGPVVPEVYDFFLRFGYSAEIPKIDSWQEYEEEDPWNTLHDVYWDEAEIKKADKVLINQVVDFFAEYTSTDLCNLVCSQSPWIDTWDTGLINCEITKEKIKEYFLREENKYEFT